jgi:uncharacterized DUF497 family protein
VEIDWDETKRITNLSKHGLDFADVTKLEWATALIEADTRFDYGEVRLRATALVGHQVHMVVFTIERRAVRIISYRRASKREVRHYVENQG